MVFSSVPVYLDPPNWPQPHAGAGGLTSDNNHHHHHHHHHNQNPQLPPPVPPPPPPAGGGGGGAAGGIKPGSMAERARLAKIPQPEAALKCPRCDSTNTKFCYFNNYSLTQPRHFCKTCRRYWTRGGALRNVPVGGGCRRNKRSSKSSNRSKSPAVSERQTGSTSSSSTLASNSCTDLLGHMTAPLQLPLLPPLHHLGDYNSGDIGVNFGGIQVAAGGGGGGGTSASNMEFQIGSSSSGGGSMLTNGLVEQWRSLQQVQQFPFLTNLEPQNGLYQFENEGVEGQSYGGQLRSKPLESAITQLAAVKMEETQQQQHHHHHQGWNLSRNFLGISGNDQYWSGSGNAWTDLSGFTSSSTTNLL